MTRAFGHCSDGGATETLTPTRDFARLTGTIFRTSTALQFTSCLVCIRRHLKHSRQRWPHRGAGARPRHDNGFQHHQDCRPHAIVVRQLSGDAWRRGGNDRHLGGVRTGEPSHDLRASSCCVQATVWSDQHELGSMRRAVQFNVRAVRFISPAVRSPFRLARCVL